jgi:hypothetical protein
MMSLKRKKKNKKKLKKLIIIYKMKNDNDFDFISNFKLQKEECRQKNCQQLLHKYEDRIPIIVEMKKNMNNYTLTKHKYMIPRDKSIGEVLNIFRLKLRIKPGESIFLLCNNQLLIGTDNIQAIYNKFKDTDGFLYIYICCENVFGQF